MVLSIGWAIFVRVVLILRKLNFLVLDNFFFFRNINFCVRRELRTIILISLVRLNLLHCLNLICLLFCILVLIFVYRFSVFHLNIIDEVRRDLQFNSLEVITKLVDHFRGFIVLSKPFLWQFVNNSDAIGEMFLENGFENILSNLFSNKSTGVVI